MERIGEYIRTGRLDQMLTKPLPLLLQVCADQFTLRRLGRITQAAIVFAWAATYVDWTPARVGVAVMMVVSGGAIFFGLFVTFSCIQFLTKDATEFANAFTYGGATLTQYPLTIFPRELMRSLTFVVPVAFVNWYPCLYLLGRDDPFGLPGLAPVLLTRRRPGHGRRRAPGLAAPASAATPRQDRDAVPLPTPH